VASGRVECAGRVVIMVGVVVALILLVVWQTVFTSAVHLAPPDLSNDTVSYTSHVIKKFAFKAKVKDKDFGPRPKLRTFKDIPKSLVRRHIT